MVLKVGRVAPAGIHDAQELAADHRTLAEVPLAALASRTESTLGRALEATEIDRKCHLTPDTKGSGRGKRATTMCKGTQRCLVALVTVLVLAAQHTASQPCLDGAAPVFEIRSLGQSHPEPGALNTITISLKASVPLASSSSIIISGLSGAVEAPRENEPLSGIIPLQGTYGGRPGLFCAFPMSSEQKPQWVESSNAAWDDKEHILTMYVCPGAEVLCEEFRFAVTVRNAADPQVAPAISVEARDASGGSTIPKVRMDGPRGHMMLLGVPQGLVALHIQNTTIPISITEDLKDLTYLLLIDVY